MNEPDVSVEFWQEQYHAGTTGWDRGEAHPAMTHWLDSGELSPCQIVVPGCGRGHEVIHLSRLGFDVTGIDYADAALEFLSRNLAAENLPAKLLNCDLLSWRPTQPLDAVYEQTCLGAIQPELRTKYEDCVYHWLKPGGKLFLLMVQTAIKKGPPFHCELNEMKKLFSFERWTWQSADFQHYTHPSGRLHELGVILVRKQEMVEH